MLCWTLNLVTQLSPCGHPWITIPVTFLVSPRFTWIQLEVAAGDNDAWSLCEETNQFCHDV